MSERKCASFLSLVLTMLALSGCPLDLAMGKFYHYDAGDQPHQNFPDENAGNGGYTDGTKLTDGATAPNSWDYWTADLNRWVGWWWQSVQGGAADLTIDLGKSKALQAFQLHAGSCTTYAIAYPAKVTFSVSDSANGPFSPVGDAVFPTDPTADAGCHSATATTASYSLPQGQTVTTRYVNVKIIPKTGNHAFVDEIQAIGEPQNAPRLVPPAINGAQGVYLGAFPLKNDLYGIGIHEWETGAQAGKQIATALWYAQWSASSATDIASFINSYMKSGYDAHRRILQVGLEPKGLGDGSSTLDSAVKSYCVSRGNTSQYCSTLESSNDGQCYGKTETVPNPIQCYILDTINAGLLDTYIRDWFNTVQATGEPVFVRFASEMNGAWSPHGGFRNGGGPESATKFVAMWQRVYNIAQQVGATNLVFVWSPGAVSFPGDDWNSPQKYYPGDQYADWVGVDVYDNINDIDTIYNAYARPFMLSETGGESQLSFVNSLFDKVEDPAFKRIMAITWFNALQYRMTGDAPLPAGAAAAAAQYATRTSLSKYLTSVTVP